MSQCVLGPFEGIIMLPKVFQIASRAAPKVQAFTKMYKTGYVGVAFAFTTNTARQLSVYEGNQLSAGNYFDSSSGNCNKTEPCGKDENNQDGNAAYLGSLGQEEHKKNANDLAGEDIFSRPWNRKERVKACLAKLKRGPDGRYTNVLEVATEVDMLIASYLKLKAKARPTYFEGDSDEEDSLEGIDVEKFKKLQRAIRGGTYEFKPAIQVQPRYKQEKK